MLGCGVLFKAHIWLVVRGEAHCNIEFRAKISISVIGEGLAFLNCLSYTHNNEEKFLRLKHWPIAAAMVTTRK